MKNIVILLPVFNDWASANLLIKKINQFFLNKNFLINILIVNDYSSDKINLNKKNLRKIKSIKVLNLSKNVGSQTAIYVGLKRIKADKKSILIVMDSDGEDDYLKLKILIQKIIDEDNIILFASRSKRLEPVYLRILNQLRLIVTLILTGKYLNMGNFSAFNLKNLKKLLKNRNISLAYSSGVIKNFKKIKYHPIEKRKRYFGKSKVNTIFILKHAINLISVFYKEVFFRTLLIFLFSAIFLNKVETLISFFCFLIINLTTITFYYINFLKFPNFDLIKNINKIK